MTSWLAQPRQIGAVTLFVEDLAAATWFYQDVFDLPVHFEDEHAAVFRFGDTLINLLDESQAAGLISPANRFPRPAPYDRPRTPRVAFDGADLRSIHRKHLPSHR